MKVDTLTSDAFLSILHKTHTHTHTIPLCRVKPLYSKQSRLAYLLLFFF